METPQEEVVFRHYSIRAEYPNNAFTDFEVNAESLTDARTKAEEKIRKFRSDATFEWRGLVVFVDRPV